MIEADTNVHDIVWDAITTALDSPRNEVCDELVEFAALPPWLRTGTGGGGGGEERKVLFFFYQTVFFAYGKLVDSFLLSSVVGISWHGILYISPRLPN